MLERLAGGRFVSAPHPECSTGAGRERLSFPLFPTRDFDAPMDPGWSTRPHPASAGDPAWVGVDPTAFSGRYGDYLPDTVGKVFPVAKPRPAGLTRPTKGLCQRQAGPPLF